MTREAFNQNEKFIEQVIKRAIIYIALELCSASTDLTHFHFSILIKPPVASGITVHVTYVFFVPSFCISYKSNS